ncbi:MAG TPA: alpha/beta hydrolase-fold protein [Anaerolineales bacterium]|nr:alpha/beta hydrolase-fold protein [Anaerolineales bacterium]
MTPSDLTIRRALESGNPIVQGNKATFIWQGEFAPLLISEVHGWEDRPRPFKQTASPTIWSSSLTVPRDAYVEYAFIDPVTQKKIPDPLNGQTVSNGMGGRNHFFYMPETMPSPFSLRRADVRSGTITRHRVDAGFLQDDGERDVYLYKPPASGAVPLLIVYDGYDYLQRARLGTIVDNLIADKRIRPIAIAFLQNGRSRRTVEYFCSDATIYWLERDVLPLARKHLRLLNLQDHPGSYGVLGASAGGLMSFYTGLRLPEIFGKVLSQAAVFSIDERDSAAVDLVRYGQGRDLAIWMDVGTLDDLLEDNRRMIAMLDKRQYNVTYREFSAGHNYTAWRNDIWHGLEAMFPYMPR